MKKVVIVTGSPRQGGNSTILAEAFARGALEARHWVDIFASVKNKIDGCIGNTNILGNLSSADESADR